MLVLVIVIYIQRKIISLHIPDILVGVIETLFSISFFQKPNDSYIIIVIN